MINGNFGLNDLSLIAMSVLCVLLAWVLTGPERTRKP